ncbi:hypothetical protein SAMN05421819_2702 [Bryocella elongata]|uniref:STAS domain-containing protein n=1 Tax=Bryocella elongata TaxID=863522 RepID=A0A1H5ZJ52_9BACT|nr:hypothetical protein SAMN05421819_2702 [Bryocella elongata]
MTGMVHDRLALQLQDDLTEKIVQHSSRGVLIDISALEIVDSFIGRMLGNIASMSRILDAQTVVVGMRPAVAKVTARPSEFTIAEFFAALRGMFRPLVTNENVQLLIEESSLLIGTTLYTDEGKLAQILRNFISNALKFTERGTVHVRAELTIDRDRRKRFGVAQTVRISRRPGSEVTPTLRSCLSGISSTRQTSLGSPCSRRSVLPCGT